MNSQNGTEIIIKYLYNQASPAETELLMAWLEDPEHQKIFDDLVKVHLASTSVLHLFDKSNVKMHLLTKMKEHEKPKYQFKISAYFKIAAVLIIALGTWFVLQNTSNTVLQETVFLPKSEAITLELEDGSIQVLNLSRTNAIKDANGKIVGSSSKDGLVYSAENQNQNIKFNTLKIPFGKKFQLQLSDGTKVFLNSGTTLRFPTAFPSQGNRTVFLNGEGFFDVVKDKNHPFNVNTDAIHVEVLGTQFNVNAYDNEEQTDVVLVEGKVALSTNNKTKKKLVHLTPGSKGSIFKNTDAISTEQVNVKPYIAWMSGTLVFKNAKFENIVKTLERHYNVKIVVKNKSLNAEIFNASFVNESIESLLKHLGDSYPIRYTIKNDVYYIE